MKLPRFRDLHTYYSDSIERMRNASLRLEAIVEDSREGLASLGIRKERDLIQQPPLIEVCELANRSKVFAVDYRCVPGNSSKVIPVDAMLNAAEARGDINLHRTNHLIFSSSGNASIWFTKIARERGYRVTTIVPDYASTPRLHALVALGADVRLIPGEYGVLGLIAAGEELEREMKGSRFLNQNQSPDNLAGFVLQGRRAVRKLLVDGISPTHFVAGMGTGGTFTGMISGIRQLVPNCVGVGVEVSEKAFLSRDYPDARISLDVARVIKEATSHDSYWLETYVGAGQVAGLSANIPSINLTSTFERRGANIVPIDNETVFKATRLLASHYHQFAGPSSGAAFAVSLAIAQADANSVVLMPICDLGERYEGDLWHREKRKTVDCKITTEIVGSQIRVSTYVQPDYRTSHMSVHEMGGPLGTAAMLHEMENTCRDLERALGMITNTNDTVGMGTIAPLSHVRYVPVGTPLEFRAEIIDRKMQGENIVTTHRVSCFAQEKTGRWELVGETIHKRCCLDVATFRQRQTQRFAPSRL